MAQAQQPPSSIDARTTEEEDKKQRTANMVGNTALRLRTIQKLHKFLHSALAWYERSSH
jgi:hypothetical protein